MLIDNEEVESGELEADWSFLPPKKIKDPSQSKPTDWDDKPTIDDPNDKKPEDWDKPEHIPDPEAVKPEDWDDEMDGEWEAPMIDNPDYKVRILIDRLLEVCQILSSLLLKLCNFFRVNGNRNKSRILTTRDRGSIPRLITPNTRPIQNYTSVTRSALSVLTCGKLNLVPFSITF